MTTNPVTAQIQVKKEEGDVTEVLRTENKVIDAAPPAACGEVGFNLSMRVPEVLISGNHAKIAAWKSEQALERTRENRPDLLDP